MSVRTTIPFQLCFNNAHLFSHAEYADMVYVYEFCNGNSKASIAEYQHRCHRHRAVSYTHLDVYKRQVGITD